MRTLCVALVTLCLSACTCSEKVAPAPAPVVAAVAVAVVDAGPVDAGAPVVDEDAGEDAGPRMTYEAEQGSPPDEALLALYAANCHANVDLSFEDMDGSQDAGECEARMFDQNCAPDIFGCWDNAEKCRDACAKPCHVCQGACGTTCDACKARCDGGACVQECAKDRLQCRRTCLYSLQTCRTTTCDGVMAKCEADADARKQKLCPDCDALHTCLDEAFEKKTPPERCLKRFPKNGKECLEWCTSLE
jgi:hypothetical protein